MGGKKPYGGSTYLGEAGRKTRRAPGKRAFIPLKLLGGRRKKKEAGEIGLGRLHGRKIFSPFITVVSRPAEKEIDDKGGWRGDLLPLPLRERLYTKIREKKHNST